LERERTRKRSKRLGINGLSTLEADIMDIIWQYKKITVREVHETMLEEGYIPSLIQLLPRFSEERQHRSSHICSSLRMKKT
jgi:hypothetical protein